MNDLHDPETRKAAQKALAGKAGIYCILCLNLRSSGKCYVGSAVNLYDRMCEHLWRNEGKSNNHLQSAIALYGLENFEYFVIELVIEKELLIKVEQKYLDIVPSNLRYNFCPTAGSRLGTNHSAETKAAIGAALSNAVYVYDSNNVLVDTFPYHTAAAAFLGYSIPHVGRLVKMVV